MARLFIDGFEHGNALDLWDAYGSNTPTIATASTYNMDGNYCLNLSPSSSSRWVQKTITADDEIYISFLYHALLYTASCGMVQFLTGSTVLGGISAGADGRLQIHTSSSATPTSYGTRRLSSNTTYLIEVRYKLSDSGVIQVKIDGVLDIDYSGDTKPGSETTFELIKFGGATYSGSGFYAYCYMDNIVLDDANWIGQTFIQAIAPTAAGNSTGWTPSTGSNWDCVEEIPVSDTNYVSINSNDVTDTYTTANLSGTINSVKCVQVQSRARKEGTSTPTNLKLVVRASGADYLSANKTLTTSFANKWNLWETNPAGGSWDESGVNGIEIGIKSAA